DGIRYLIVTGVQTCALPISWDHIGALDPSRVEAHSHGWMLPSSHLIFRESPDDAARRIAREQLELPDLALTGPTVVSEVYTPKRSEERRVGKESRDRRETAK